jgi:hypothetical protein
MGKVVQHKTATGSNVRIGVQGAHVGRLDVSGIETGTSDLNKDISVTPNGVLLVKPHIRVGVLPKLLKEVSNNREQIIRLILKNIL